MRNLLKPFLLVIITSFVAFSQTPNVQFVGGSSYLPSHGSVGVTLYCATNALNYVWYKRVNNADVLLQGGPRSITLFEAGQYLLKTSYPYGGSGTSALITINAEAPTMMNKMVKTDILHAGVKTEADLLIPSSTGSHGMNTIIYYDNFGRAAQTVSCQTSPSKLDIVVPIAYDDFGRIPVSYLPYTSTNTGNYRTHANALTEQAAFYSATGQKRATTTMPYSRKVQEKSEFGTLLEQGSVGEEYQPNSTTPEMGKTTKSSYNTNNDSEVLIWAYNETTTEATYTFAVRNTITKNKVLDPEGKEMRVYIDASGKVISKVVTFGTDARSDKTTHYVYDKKGRLVYEFMTAYGGLSPKKFTSSSTTCLDYMHYYQYDYLDRMWYHRAPGAQPVYTVYDRQNRPILTQNGEQRKLNKWSFVKYDKLGRLIFTGIYTDKRTTPLNATQLQNLVDTEKVLWEVRKSGTIHGYSEELAFPRTNSDGTTQLFSINYYDDYNFDYDNNNINGRPDVDFVSNTTEMGTQLPIPEYNVSGKATCSKTRVVGSATEKWIWNVVFYDEMRNVIQTRSNSHVPTYTAPTTLAAMNTMLTNYVTVWVDFTGKTTKSVEKHFNAIATTSMLIKKSFEYDHAGRLLREYQQNNTDTRVLVKELKYNELGQVIEKNLHKPNGKTSFLQSVDYTYNTQGKLTHINNPELSASGNGNNDDSNDLFGLQVYYHTSANLTNGVTTPKYNGMVSAVTWRTNNTNNASSSKDYYLYQYEYDSYNQLFYSYLASKTSSPANFASRQNFYERFDKDPNGNIYNLQRNSQSGTLMDNLLLSYTGNKATFISEAATEVGGFTRNTSITSNAYVYNDNGNVIEDKNKGITVEYNHMDLVSKITWKNAAGVIQGTISYLYDASGNMLQKTNQPITGLGTVVDYIDGFYYANNDLKFFVHGEGRVTKSGTVLSYEYNLNDHQGYTRINFVDNNGVPKVVQENHFYPSGLRWNWGTVTPWNSSSSLFMLQDKEWQEEGFNGQPLAWYDFGARMYDPAVSRWWAQDPMYQYDSPYVYCGNDPINGYDPDGAWNIWDDLRTGANDLGNDPGFRTGLAVAGVVAGVGLSFVPGAQGFAAPLLMASTSYLTGYGNAVQQGYSSMDASNYALQQTQFSISGNFYLPQSTRNTVPTIEGFNPDQYKGSGFDLRNSMAYMRPIPRSFYMDGFLGDFLYGVFSDATAFMMPGPQSLMGSGGKVAANIGVKALSKAAKGGTTVLGHYPQYVKLAESLGARRFQIPPSVWNKMSAAEQWTANTKFLDRMILRGDNIRLATPLNQVKQNSWFARELEYLYGKGYKASSDGLWLVK